MGLELIEEAHQLARGEFRLALSRWLQEVSGTGRLFGWSAVFAVVGVLGCASLFAGLIFGLGELLGGRYWQSCFLMGMISLLICGLGLKGTFFSEEKKKNKKSESP